MLETHVYPNGKIGVWQLLLSFYLAGEYHIPVLTLPLDRAGFRLPLHQSMLLDFHMPNLGKDDFAVFDPYDCLALELFKRKRSFGSSVCHTS